MSGARHRRRPEDAIQRAVFQHLRARAAPGVFAFHVPNGGYRKPVEAAIMKGLGAVASWRHATSSGGVAVEVGHLRSRALVERSGGAS
jgi:hypothetical protein